MTVVNVSTDGAGQTDQSDRVTVDVTCPIVSGGSRRRSAQLWFYCWLIVRLEI